MDQSKGLLLINLGTPNDPGPASVKAWLDEFLMDPEVIDLPTPLRWFLVRQVILRRRPKKSSEAYKKIWTPQGSPIRLQLDALVSLVRSRWTEGPVTGAMRYGTPSIADELRKLKDQSVDELVVFPLYPQWASSTHVSTERAVKAQLAHLNWQPETNWIGPFYNRIEFIKAWKAVAEQHIKEFRADHVLMSFHGLPKRHIQKWDKNKICVMNECCEVATAPPFHCYRAQCFMTARLLARNLSLPEGKYTVGFQSRLTQRWIKPFSDHLFEKLAKQGVKRLAVMCPAFVADCLETLEEIGIRGYQQFVKAGGEDLKLIPSLNATPEWADAVVHIARTSGKRTNPVGLTLAPPGF